MQFCEAAAVGIDFENASVAGSAASVSCAVKSVADENHSSFNHGAIRQIQEDAIAGAIGVDFENGSTEIRAAADSGAVECVSVRCQFASGAGAIVNLTAETVEDVVDLRR